MNNKELQGRNLSLKWSWFDIQNNTYDGLIGITSIHIIRRDLLVCHSIKVDCKYGQHITRTKHFFYQESEKIPEVLHRPDFARNFKHANFNKWYSNHSTFLTIFIFSVFFYVRSRWYWDTTIGEPWLRVKAKTGKRAKKPFLFLSLKQCLFFSEVTE